MIIATEDGEVSSFDNYASMPADAPRVNLWRYSVRRDERGDWAIVYLESDGRLVVHSSFGAYGCWWNHESGDFRERVADMCERGGTPLGSELLCQLSSPDWFDGATVQAWFENAIEGFAESIETEDQMWELAAKHGLDLVDSAPGFHTYPPDAVALCDRILPRLARLIRAQLAVERGYLPVKSETTRQAEPGGAMPIERALEIAGACARHCAAPLFGGEQPPLPDCSLEEMLAATRIVAAYKPPKSADGTTPIHCVVAPRGIAAAYALAEHEGRPASLLKTLGFTLTRGTQILAEDES